MMPWSPTLAEYDRLKANEEEFERLCSEPPDRSRGPIPAGQHIDLLRFECRVLREQSAEKDKIIRDLIQHLKAMDHMMKLVQAPRP